MPGDHRLTLKQACDILGKKERTVRRYVQTGLLSKTYVDGDNGWELRLSEAEVRALASGTPLPRAGDGDSPAASGAPDRERAFAEPPAQSAPGEPANGASPYVAAEGIVIAPQGEAGDPRARTASAARRRDDPGDLRLAEAFERFFELVQREYEAGRDAYLLGLEKIARAERSGDESAPGKGVWMLHVLRRTVGDEAFFAILRTWVERYGGGSATTASTIRHACSTSSWRAKSSGSPCIASVSSRSYASIMPRRSRHATSSTDSPNPGGTSPFARMFAASAISTSGPSRKRK